MAIKDNFLKEIKIGDAVELMIGAKEITGTVIALDLETVRIRRENGKEPVFSLDAISYYEVDEDALSEKKGSQGETMNRSEKEKSEAVEIIESKLEKRGYQEEHLSRTIDDYINELKSRGDLFFDELSEPAVRDYKEIAKTISDSKLKNDISSIANSVQYAIDQAHEISPADYKIQENIGKIKRLVRKYPKSKAPYNLLGAVYFACKSEGLSIEAYLSGDDNESAFAVAKSLNKKEQMLIFAARHFVFDKNPNASIYSYVLNEMIQHDDYSLLSRINIKDVSSECLRAYHSALRLVFLANNVEYNGMLDFDVTLDSLNDLMKIYKGKNIGSKSEFLSLLPKEVAVESKAAAQKDTRSLEECPTFAAAEQARMVEKDLVKAEKLYTEAIKKGEKAGSAVANLYQILIQQDRYYECAVTLGKYGAKYMRGEAYANLRKQLISNYSKGEKIIVKYEKAQNIDGSDYFVIAQNAEIEEKDLQKAITYYKKAIQAKQRISASVPNLASIYARLEMFDDALALLNAEGANAMGKAAFLNLKQTILGKARNKKYISEVEDVFRQQIELSTSAEKKNDYMFSEAYMYLQMEEYGKAVEKLLVCLDRCKEKNFSTKDKFKNRKKNILASISNAYFRSGKLEEANAYAEELLKEDPENEIAKSILNGSVNDDVEIISENMGTTHISGFIKSKIDELSLETEVKNKKSLKNGIFTSAQDEAIRILDAIGFDVDNAVNEESKSNSFFAGAKLVKQLLDRDEKIINPKVINEKKYLLFIAEGSCAYANARLIRTEIANNVDTARYLYIQNMSILNDWESDHPSWIMSTIRYIQTYLYSLDEIKKKRIDNLLSGKKNYIEYLQEDMKRTVKEEIDLFTIGMLEMLAYNTRIKKNILSMINANSSQGPILDALSLIVDEKVPDIDSDEKFIDLWDRATQMFLSTRKSIVRTIQDTVEDVFAVGQLGQNMDILNSIRYEIVLNRRDREYIRDLYEIFNCIARYNEISEFDYKAETLSKAEDQRRRLVEKIEEYPTYFGYEKLRAELEQLQAKIYKESGLLYGNSEPQIVASISGECSVDEATQIVRVPIAFVNKTNSQNADNVRISVGGDNVSIVNDIQLSRGLLVGNGRPKEEMFTFKIAQEVLEEKTFSLEIHVEYQYKQNMTEVKEASYQTVLPVSLYSDSQFITIENKFEPHKNGSAVKDVSMFYGRDKDLENIIAQISDSNGKILQGRCLALYGQTRTGKSSLLYHLERRLREINTKGNIIVNIGSIGEENLSGNDITEFLYTILDGLKSEVDLNHSDLIQLFEDNGIVIDADKLLGDPEHSQLYFNNIFKKICRLLAEQTEQYNVVIMIDEFTYIYDWIRQGSMTDRIMKFWKAFIQNNGIFAVIIGQDHMMKFVQEKQFTNDFGSTDLQKVTYLCEEDAKRLMYEPIMLSTESGELKNRYNEEALDRLYELTSGSAFLIMNVCAGLVDYLNEIHAVYITRAHIEDYLKKNLASFEESRFFEPQYDDKSEVEKGDAVERNKRMLRRIAQRSNKKEWTPLQNVISSDEDRKTIDNLQLRDVIEVSNNDRCKIKVALYKEWILEKYGLEEIYD